MRDTTVPGTPTALSVSIGSHSPITLRELLARSAAGDTPTPPVPSRRPRSATDRIAFSLSPSYHNVDSDYAISSVSESYASRSEDEMSVSIADDSGEEETSLLDLLVHDHLNIPSRIPHGRPLSAPTGPKQTNAIAVALQAAAASHRASGTLTLSTKTTAQRQRKFRNRSISTVISALSKTATITPSAMQQSEAPSMWLSQSAIETTSFDHTPPVIVDSPLYPRRAVDPTPRERLRNSAAPVSGSPLHVVHFTSPEPKDLLDYIHGRDTVVWGVEQEKLFSNASHKRKRRTERPASAPVSSDLERKSSDSSFALPLIASNAITTDEFGDLQHSMEHSAAEQYVRVLLKTDKEIMYKKHRGPFTSEAGYAKLKVLEEHGPHKVVQRRTAAVEKRVRQDQKQRRKNSVDKSSGTFKQRIAAEVMKSRKYCFHHFMKLLKDRDAAKQRGDLKAFGELSKRLREIDVYNPDFHNPEFTEIEHTFIDERDTRLLVKDLHNYSLYCYTNRLSLIIRDVANGAASAYTGTFHLPDEWNDNDGIPLYERIQTLTPRGVRELTDHRIKVEGKGITVGLKSSPYEPILGLIPLDPRLSKLVKAFAQNVRELEEMLLKSGEQGTSMVEDMTVNIMKLAKAENETGLILAKYAAENEKAMKKSEHLYEDLVDEYNKEMQYVYDKEAVSLEWLDKFNDARFLGVRSFRSITDDPVFYFTKGQLGEIARDDKQNPIFVTKVGDSRYQLFNQATKCFEWAGGAERTQQYLSEGFTLEEVQVVVYRKFAINKITKRIQEDMINVSMIVPDYDGFAYTFDRDYPEHIVDISASDEDNVKKLCDHFHAWEEQRRQCKYTEGMGEVSKMDLDHVLEVRALTDWKQNHGEEVNNIYKTQEITKGNYCTFTSDGTLHMLHDPKEIFDFYRHLWSTGRPMPLNPKWPVSIDADGYPYFNPKIEVYDNKLDMGKLHDALEKPNSKWTMQTLETAFAEYYREPHIERKMLIGPLKNDPIFAEFCRLKDEEKVLNYWVQVNRFKMIPKLVLCDRHRYACDPQKADLIDRLMPQVVQAFEARRMKMVDQAQKELNKQRNEFFHKHNVDCRV